MTKIENDKDFLVIEMSWEEAQRCNFGIPGEGCICMHCNRIIKEPIYYIAVLNDTMDKECFDEWYENAVNYPEDRVIEKHNFNFYFKK